MECELGKKKMKILFLCTGNAYRSPLAEALLKKLRPDLKVDSAGLIVAIPISMQIRAYLKEHAASDFLKPYPESIDEKEFNDYDVIVAMEPKHKSAVLKRCPNCEKRVIVWNIEDPYLESDKDAQRIFAEIEKRVKILAESL